MPLALRGVRKGDRVVCAGIHMSDTPDRLGTGAELQETEQALRQAAQIVAIVEDRGRIALGLNDTVVQRLFGEGLKLAGLLAQVDEPTRVRLESVVDGLDAAIKEIRCAIFSLQTA